MPNNVSPLGQPVSHAFKYHPQHLFSILRKEERAKTGIDTRLPFRGADIWNAYEVSWLDPMGKPVIAIGTFRFAAETRHIIESKSVKLYLNSFNQTSFPSFAAVSATIQKDLAEAADGEVAVSLWGPTEFDRFALTTPEGRCLDHLDVAIDCYRPDPGFLKSGGRLREETLYSNLLRTNCPVTGQPDWATLIIDYQGPQIDPKGLLRYLVSFREHEGFHENCIERIFIDIVQRCQPERLSILAQFTRRGGIDINPFRTNAEMLPRHLSLNRRYR